MNMRIVRLRAMLVAALLVVSTVAAFADGSVAGKWVLDVKLGDGQGVQATLDLKEEGGKITGTYTGALGTRSADRHGQG
jgi:hypothetical protein